MSYYLIEIEFKLDQISAKFRFSLTWASILSEAMIQFSPAHALPSRDIQARKPLDSSLYHCLWFLE